MSFWTISVSPFVMKYSHNFGAIDVFQQYKKKNEVLIKQQ